MGNKLIEKYKKTPAQIKASLWAVICGALQKGINLITTPVFTRLLSTSEYGQYSVFNSWLLIVTIIVSLNLYIGVYQQGLVKFSDDEKKFSSSLQGLSLVLSLAWLAVYLPFHSFWNELLSLTTTQMLLMLLFVWLSSVIGFWSTEQRNKYKYKALVAVTLTVSVLSPITSIVLIKYLDEKVTAKILGTVLVAFIIYLPLFFIQMKNGKTIFSAHYWKYALAFNLPLVPHYLSQIILSSSDRIMIERMVDDSSAGIYGLAYTIGMLVFVFNSALMNTIRPWIYQRIKAEEINKIAPVTYMSLISIAAVNIMLIIIAPEAVKIFAPAEYYEAIWVIPPVSISTFLIFCYELFVTPSLYYEKRLFTTLISVFSAIINIILNAVFIKKYGYIAAGYTTLVCYFIYTLSQYLYMNIVCKKNCDGVKPYNTKIITFIVGAFAIVGLSIMFTYNYLYIRYALLVVFMLSAVLLRKRIFESFKTILSLRKI